MTQHNGIRPESRSKVGSYLCLGTNERIPFNGALQVFTKVRKNVAELATQADVGALYTNAQEGLPMKQCSEESGHHQPATPLKTNTNRSQGIIDETIRRKQSKAIHMHFRGYETELHRPNSTSNRNQEIIKSSGPTNETSCWQPSP